MWKIGLLFNSSIYPTKGVQLFCPKKHDFWLYSQIPHDPDWNDCPRCRADGAIVKVPDHIKLQAKLLINV